jgi:hypothetical protein|tara:strand:- start:55 stop:186 length:132 start_codon:yes stop_codon:yes gene_type:complete
MLVWKESGMAKEKKAVKAVKKVVKKVEKKAPEVVRGSYSQRGK